MTKTYQAKTSVPQGAVPLPQVEGDGLPRVEVVEVEPHDFSKDTIKVPRKPSYKLPAALRNQGHKRRYFGLMKVNGVKRVAFANGRYHPQKWAAKFPGMTVEFLTEFNQSLHELRQEIAQHQLADTPIVWVYSPLSVEREVVAQ